MPSYALDIGNAVVAVVEGITGAPDVVELRDNDQVGPRDPEEIVVVTLGAEVEVDGTSGAGSGDDYGGVFKTYEVGVSIYHRKLTGPATDLTLTPPFVLACKQALNRPRLSGASTVYGSRLAESNTWENQEFRKGLLVSRFGILFLSSESRAGG